MNEGEMNRLLARMNPWWRTPAGGDVLAWERDDPDLRKVREAGYEYTPEPLRSIAPDGLYVLLGPRRIGKSVELKRSISSLLKSGVAPREIIHCSCDRMTAADLARLEHVGRNVATAREAGPRYWFLDEITAITDGWPSEIKRLRNETAFGNDCVILTGSSSRDLATARHELAGRRGVATDRTRILLPMSFRSFCRAVRSDAPAASVIRAEDVIEPVGRDAIYELQPWLNDLTALWYVYLEVGGYPGAVADYVNHQSVQSPTVDDLWDVVSGEMQLRRRLSPTNTQTLLEQLVLRLTQPMVYRKLGNEIGVSHPTAQGVVDDLTEAFVTWRLYQEKQMRPNPAAQHKVYFLDPLAARLAATRNATGTPIPDPSVLTEQQLGVALLRQFEERDLGEFAEFSEVMFMKTPSRNEIDFVSPRFPSSGFEGKFVDTGIARDAQTLGAQFGRGVLATRVVVDLTQPVFAVPASFIAYLLST